MAATLELLMLNMEWSPSNPTKNKCKDFVECHVYDRASMQSRSYRLDVGGPPVTVTDISEKRNCFLWLRVLQEKKNLLGHLKQTPIEGVDPLGLDLSQPPNLSPNYRVPNDPAAKVNVTLQARWMGGKKAPVPMAISKDVPKWQFFREEDGQWVDYGVQFTKGINQALESGFTSFKLSGVHITVDGQTGTHRNKKSGTSRPIRCVDIAGSPYDYMAPCPAVNATGAKPEFRTLGPFGVIPYVNLLDYLHINIAAGTYQLQRPDLLGMPFTSLSTRTLKGHLSSATPLPPMSETDAARCCIPRAARRYLFLYPMEGLVGMNGLDFHDPRHAALSLGGFIYLDSQNHCLALNGLTASGEGLYFSERYRVAKKACPAKFRDRMCLIVFPGFSAVGARRFTWLAPEEEFPGLPVRNLNGGLLFEVAHDPDHFAYFAVQAIDPSGTLFVAHTMNAMNVKHHNLVDAHRASPALIAHEPDNAPPAPVTITPPVQVDE